MCEEIGKPQQAPCWATLMTLVAPVAALLAALDLQQASGEAAPLVEVALVVGNHRQALCWATLAMLVAAATAPSAALDLHRGCLQHRCHL